MSINDVGGRLSRDPEDQKFAVNSNEKVPAALCPVSTDAPGVSAAPPSPPSPPSSRGEEKTLPPAVAVPETPAATIFQAGPVEAGEGGEGGYRGVTNADFVAAVITRVPEGASAAVCSKRGDPTLNRWLAERVGSLDEQCPEGNNNYLNCSSFRPGSDGKFYARKDAFTACHFLMLDDLGTKVPVERLGGFELSWRIETSPGNFQGGIILADPITDAAAATGLQSNIIAAGLCDPGASGLSRWARLPVAINGKAKCADEMGTPFCCQLSEWHPDRRYSPQQIVDGLQLDLVPARKPVGTKAQIPRHDGDNGDDVFTPRAAENPVIAALKERGLYKMPLGSGKHDVRCPWFGEHTEGLDTGAAYFEPSEFVPVGGFCCQHSHGDRYHIGQLLEFLGVPNVEARHMPVIRIVGGAIHLVVSAAERQLAAGGRYFQSGGLIVSIATDPATGDSCTIPTGVPALTRELSVIAAWEKFDGRSRGWVRCDPPTRHVSVLFDAQTFRHLLPLVGVTRQPYFRETDGELVSDAGYDSMSRRFGVFDPRQFVMPEPTEAAARAALAKLDALLVEFHFVSAVDRAAALAAILTAVARPTLPHAPAFHVKAPRSGSGKSYLCDVIGAFSGPAVNRKVSYPTTSEEATKVMPSLLLTSPAVIEFDDMDTDWIPHGTINRMLTSSEITDRILGVSKTATVSTRTLVLGSGNNVGPIRDLLRRVLTINLDPRCEAPAMLNYRGSPVETVRGARGAYVAAVLTIIQAWRRAGSPRAAVSSIATYGGAWADYCRFPLLWLGCPDPATTLLEQVRHDPDGDALGRLMIEWYRVFKSTPTTVRKAVDTAEYSKVDLRDAMCEFPIEERGSINRSKLGWILKKNANRIVSGFEFQKTEADGRTAWRVVPVDSPPSPPSPPLPESAAKTVARVNDEGGEL